jgi:hypothetical protein
VSCCTTREGDLPLIVAIDLQPMAPIEGVIQVQGDITNARTAEVVRWTETSVCLLLAATHVSIFSRLLGTLMDAKQTWLFAMGLPMVK